jgi:NDP-sugar pyrophosphorylase family protein
MQHERRLMDSENMHFLSDKERFPVNHLPMSAVIMAGGFGARLRPLTDNLPKPLLPIGERPIMELTVEQLRDAGIRRLYVTTHYLPEKIMDHFGDGRSFGIKITYVREDNPLGTAGALGLIEKTDQSLLLINGDIITKLDFRAMWAFHRVNKAALTVAVRQHELQVPYGVMESEGIYLRQVREKPRFSFLVNAGIYLLEPVALGYIPAGERFDMTDLMQSMLHNRQMIANFPIPGYWLDVGRHADYKQAQKDFQDGKF